MTTINGANIDGNLDTGGGSFIGHDQVIQNIIIVGRLLDLASIEGLLPKALVENRDFESISQALEKQIPADFSTSLVFVGEILGDLLKKYLPESPHGALNLKAFTAELARQVGQKLWALNYFEVFGIEKRVSQLNSAGLSYAKAIELSSTFNLCGKFKVFEDQPCFLVKLKNYEQYFFAWINRPSGSPEEINLAGFSNQQLRVFITGVVLDLIRLHMAASPDADFIRSIIDFLGQTAGNNPPNPAGVSTS